MKTRKKAKKRLKKTIVSVSPELGLVLEGAVYVVEKSPNGKIIRKVALDNQAVLQALSYVLLQSIKKP
jgi:hypothetical protein